MVAYTISFNFLESLQETNDYRYIFSILFPILNSRNDSKIAVDKNCLILSKYKEINNSFKAHIAEWVKYIGYAPSSIEKTRADLSNISKENMCLEICKFINGGEKNLIVYSRSLCPFEIGKDSHLDYGGVSIRIFDKDDAEKAINPDLIIEQCLIVKDSAIATGGSNINNSNNKP